eukprot:4563743-Prymnesium_polylepis.1
MAPGARKRLAMLVSAASGCTSVGALQRSLPKRPIAVCSVRRIGETTTSSDRPKAPAARSASPDRAACSRPTRLSSASRFMKEAVSKASLWCPIPWRTHTMRTAAPGGSRSLSRDASSGTRSRRKAA